MIASTVSLSSVILFSFVHLWQWDGWTHRDRLRPAVMAVPPIASASAPMSSQGRPGGMSDLGSGTGVGVGVGTGAGVPVGVGSGVLVGVGVGVEVRVGAGDTSWVGVASGSALSAEDGVGGAGVGAVSASGGASSTSMYGAPPMMQPWAQLAPGKSR